MLVAERNIGWCAFGHGATLGLGRRDGTPNLRHIWRSPW